MESKPLVFALQKADGTHLRVETAAHAIYDEDRDEIVMAFRNTIDADTIFRQHVGTMRRAWAEQDNDPKEGFTPCL